jgi:hypothetical protein
MQRPVNYTLAAVQAVRMVLLAAQEAAAADRAAMAQPIQVAVELGKVLLIFPAQEVPVLWL